MFPGQQHKPTVQVWQFGEKRVTSGPLSDPEPEISVISSLCPSDLVWGLAARLQPGAPQVLVICRESWGFLTRGEYKLWAWANLQITYVGFNGNYSFFVFMYLETAFGGYAMFLSITSVKDEHIKYSKQEPWRNENQHLFLSHLFTRLLHGFHKRTHTRDIWVKRQNQICKSKGYGTWKSTCFII